MSLGKALIATDLGFSVEAVTEGYNGSKFKLGDTDEFVSKITGLWSDPVKAREMGLNARKEYEDKYMPEDNYTQLMNIYNSVAGK
jgi:glycosyltransferase involved in cell wall biosynthesis